LTNGMAGCDAVVAVSAFEAAARATSPPSHELFIAYWGNPRYALLPELAAVNGAASTTGTLRLVSAFRGQARNPPC